MQYITRKTKGAHPKQKLSTSVQKVNPTYREAFVFSCNSLDNVVYSEKLFTLSLQDNVDCDLGDVYCSDLDGEFFELFNSPIRTSKKTAVNEDEDGLDNLAHKVTIVDGLDYLSQKVYEVIDFYNFY